jgi:hypothetical protein
VRFIYLGFGFAIGLLACTVFASLTYIPRTERTIAQLRTISDESDQLSKECISTLTECSETLLKQRDTMQAIIDTANYCVDVLWTLPIEGIQELRTKPEPDPLPNVGVGKVENSFDLPPDGVHTMQPLTIQNSTFL